MDREEWNQKLAQARAEAWDPRAKKPPWHMVYYMSSHGWGHFTRSLHIVARLARNPKFATIWVVVDLPPSVVRKRLAPMLTEAQLKKITFREYPMDFGLSQKDAVTTDWERSRANARALLEYWDKIVVQEGMWLRAWGFHFVMSDIPAIPFDAAAVAGILSFAVGNFTWDWIYNELPDVDDIWLELALKFRRAYDKGNVWFRLPFTQPDYAPKFEMEIPVGLLSQPGRNRRFELAAATGAAAYGVEMGGEGYNITVMANSWMTMALNGCGWLLVVLLLTPSMDKMRTKMGGGDDKWLALITASASIGLFAYMATPYYTLLKKVPPTAWASITGTIAMVICAKLSKKAPWLKEYGLGIAIVAGIIVGAILDK